MAHNPHNDARALARHQARAVLRAPTDGAAHLTRLQMALRLDGEEPAQGALADLFCSFGADGAALKSAALRQAAPRLSAAVAQRFAAWVAQPALPRTTPLATRWSVIAGVSADVRTRQRRCSADGSRAVAAQALAAWRASDLVAQEQFLHHCLTCHDKLAFMLARRAVVKAQGRLPEAWAATGRVLEKLEEIQ